MFWSYLLATVGQRLSSVCFLSIGTGISLDKCAHYHRMCSLSALRSIDAGTLLPAPWPLPGHKVGYFMNATWQPMDRQKDNKHVASHSHRIPIRIRLWLGRNSNLLQRMEEDAERERERGAAGCVSGLWRGRCALFAIIRSNSINNIELIRLSGN